MTWTVTDCIARLPRPAISQLPAPEYNYSYNYRKIMLAVESMRRHMTDEGWQIAAGLEHAGYTLCGRNLTVDETDVPTILARTGPGIAVVQDKREWDVPHGSFRDADARFHKAGCLSDRPDIFKLTILKDSQNSPTYHKDSALEIGCHAWIVYYHPRIVAHLAPYVRPEHLIRTYHSIDQTQVPPFTAEGRDGCLLSGAVSRAYPLRQLLVKRQHLLYKTTYHQHPGYHRDGCMTPDYLKLLSRFKVAICTASMYGYSLRRMFEATACGCRILTDLPTDDRLPGIDANLFRIHPATTPARISEYLHDLCETYDPDRQEYLSCTAKEIYDYHNVGRLLATDILTMRTRYGTGSF